MLVELLVASVCAALVGSAALTLLLNGATASARARGRTHGGARARACRDVLVANLRRGFGALEGASTAYREGLGRPRVEQRDQGVVLLQSLEESAEIAIDDDGRYRLPPERSLGAFVPGAAVAALPAIAGSIVLGEVVSVDTNEAGTRLGVNWSAADVARLPDPVRALTPVRWREFAFVNSDRGVELRRRDHGGTWQPIVEGLVEIELLFASDLNGDRVAEAPAVPWDQAALPAHAARVTCRVEPWASTATGWASAR